MTLQIEGYQISAQIYESANSLLYRAIRQQDNRPVILKILKQDYPTPSELTRYKQEYEITRYLNLEGIAKAYSLKTYQRTLVIILEDFAGSSLKQLMNKSPGKQKAMPLGDFLTIAIKTADSLGHIHANNIIHKDINPANIVYNPKTQQLKIIDFGISTQLTRENPTLKNPDVLEGTLAYISPEQTGRMNRALDYRTDFYSLGVTFYELLTGVLPFETDDALELVYCHIAKQPVLPHQINQDIPEVLSEIVMKLMAKTAEERYQSAWGLKTDLEECFRQLQTKGNISSFPLGTKDISDKFQIPQKLYGREAEVEILLAAFERVAGEIKNEKPGDFSSQISHPKSKIELMLVAGYSGIGKSSLIAEIHKLNTRLRGYFIEGKFDQFQRNIPYSAIVEAFKGLVRQLLTESEIKLNQWREKLLAAFGENGQVIIDVIPEVELIVGKQPPVPVLGFSESRNLFNLVFQKFILAFCSKEHPLVIFLDDLQWADSATLKLIELMMMDTNIQYLFLIGAYRDNEVSATHPLIMTLNELQKQGATIDFINLSPLKIEYITELIADTLHSTHEWVKPLAELVMRKTGGNPFFVNQFMKTLQAENLIKFDFQRYAWQWDISNIEAQNITDNVVELMIGKLKKLPESTQQVLRLASCVGASFDLNTLSIVCEKPKKEIFTTLVTAVQSGLILPTSQLDTQLLIQDYKFLHDRVQQAAYALIDESQKKTIHLQIGRLLLQNTTSKTLPDLVFEIVDHLNLGIEFVTAPQERNQVVKLNLMAGQKAKASTAYGAAIKYLQVGRELLSVDSWQTDYELTLALYEQAAEAAYLNGNFEQMDQLVEVVLKQAKSVLEKLKVYDVKIQSYAIQSKPKEALKVGLQVLNILGVILPEEPSQLDIQKGLEETASLVARQEIEDLINLPEMAAPEQLAAMHILSSMAASAFVSGSGLFVLMICQQVNLSIKYGNATWSALAYACYGLVLNGVVLDIELGYRFGCLSANLVELLNIEKLKSKIFDVLGGHIIPWKEHLRDTLPVLIEGFQSGVETGDFEMAGYCAFNACHNLYCMGCELTEIEQKISTYSKAIAQIRQEISFNCIGVVWQKVLNLLSRSENPKYLTGDAYNLEKTLPCAIASNDRIQLHHLYLHKLILTYLFGDYSEAKENAVLAEHYLDGVTGMIAVPLFHFYDALLNLAVFTKAANSDKEAILNRVNNSQEKMQKWVHHGPMNYLHKFHLVEAEKARVLGRFFEAEEFYEQAISGAAENGFIQEEALAYELAAKFYLERGRLKIAQTYMKEAHYAYKRWGAKAKAEYLEAKYPQLLPKSSPGKNITSTQIGNNTTTSSSQSTSALDLDSVMKASQAISGEIVLNKLLVNLMKILIQNAGAQIGYLILETQGKLQIEASGVMNLNNIQVLQSVPIENRLPTTIINYVVRTKETVVLNDATREGNFTNDPYIKQHKTKSLLCAPLLDRSQLSGIVYMENNLTTGAFTPNRLSVLQLLSGQAAISIENARLYRTLDDKVKERTAQLAKANQEITALNEMLKQENFRMRAELEVTKQLQQMILPKQSELESIEGLEIAGFMEPADEVGGDYYDVLQQDGKVKIAIGDVTGHGLESGVLMLMTQTGVRTLQESNQTDPVQFLEILNRTIYRNAQRINPYKNLTLTLLDYSDRTLRISGQHEEIIIVRASGQLELIDTQNLGFPIGLEKEIADFIAAEEVQLNSGDVVVLYTDGVTEAFDRNQVQYGLNRLCEVVKSNCYLSAEGIKQAIIADVRRHIGKQKVFDDLTLVVIKQK